MARGGFFSVDSLNGIHVLVVVHDAEGRELLAAILRYCGALVTTVGGPDEALDTMRLVKANAIIVEVRPGADALQLIRKIRSLKPEEGGVIPAVAVSAAHGGVTATAHGEEHGPHRTLGAGFEAHLRKPIDPWELCSAVARAVRRPA